MTEDTRQNIIDAAIRVGERLGVPCLLLAVILWFGREAAISLSETVLQPVVKSHVGFLNAAVGFLDATKDTLDAIAVTQASQAETLREIADGQQDIQRAVRTTGKH